MPGTDAILKQIQSALEHEPRSGVHSHPILIGVSNGVVDRLRVQPGKRKDDGQIRDSVRSLLLTEPILQNCTQRIRAKGQVESRHEVAGEMGGAIEVSVKEGVITLDGQVISLSHKRLAGVLAWAVFSVDGVTNRIEVQLTQYATLPRRAL